MKKLITSRTKVFHSMDKMNDYIEAWSKRNYKVEVRTRIVDGDMIHKVTRSK